MAKLGKVTPPPWAETQIPSIFSKEYQDFLAFVPPDLKVIEKSWRDDTIRQRGLSTVQDMLGDARVSQASDLKKSAVINVGFKVSIDTEVITDVPLAKEVRQFVDFLFTEIRGSRYEFLKNVLSAFDYGYSFNVLTLKAMKRGKFKGKWVCDYVTPIPPSAYKIAFAENGSISHLESNLHGMAPKGQQETIKKIGLDRVIYMKIGGNFNSPYGKSQITKVYEAWWNKRILRRMRNTAMDRFGTPFMVGRVSPNTTDKKRAHLLKTISRMSIEGAGVINNDESIDAIQTGGLAGVDAFQQALAFEDKEIVAGIAGSTLNVMEGGSQGSYAQARVHQDNFLYSVQEIIQILEDVINEQFVYRMVAMNYGEDVADGVKVNWQPVSDPQIDSFVARFTQLAPLIFDQSDPREKAWVRKMLDWPDINKPMSMNEKGEMIDPDTGNVLISAPQAQMMGLSQPVGPDGAPLGGGGGQQPGQEGAEQGQEEFSEMQGQSESPDYSEEGYGNADDSWWQSDKQQARGYAAQDHSGMNQKKTRSLRRGRTKKVEPAIYSIYTPDGVKEGAQKWQV
jgi:hypothetical protein